MDDITKPENTDQTKPEEPPKIDDVAPAGNEAGSPPTVLETPKSPSQGRPRGKMMWIVAVVVALAAIGAGAYLLTKKKPAAKSSTNTSGVVHKEIAIARYGTQELPLNTFYPGRESSAIAFDVNRQMFEGLVTYEKINQITPLLATKWTNPDNKTWLFDIKQNVKFHTGRVMTTDDVKKSLDYAVAQGNKDPFGALNKTIATVEVVSATQVKITTKNPDPLLLNRLNSLLIFDTTGKANDPANGTGPYQIKAGTTPAEKDVWMSAFDDYHQGKPTVREVHYIGFDDEDSMVAAVLKGDLDITNDLSDDALIKTDAVLARLDAEPLFVTFIGFSTLKTNSPTAKLAVRQAFQLAIDQSKIIEAAKKHAATATQIIPKSIPGYNDAIKTPTRDVAKAKTLLTNAGFPKGVTLSYAYGDIQAPYMDEIVQEVAEAGITMVGTRIEVNSVTDLINAAKSKKYDAFAYTISTDLLDLSDVVSAVLQKSTSVLNNYSNPAVDKALAESDVIIKPEDRIAKLKELSKLIADDVPVVPIRSTLYTYNVPKNWVIAQDTAQGDLGVYFWHIYAK